MLPNVTSFIHHSTNYKVPQEEKKTEAVPRRIGLRPFIWNDIQIHYHIETLLVVLYHQDKLICMNSLVANNFVQASSIFFKIGCITRRILFCGLMTGKVQPSLGCSVDNCHCWALARLPHPVICLIILLQFLGQLPLTL